MISNSVRSDRCEHQLFDFVGKMYLLKEKYSRKNLSLQVVFISKSLTWKNPPPPLKKIHLFWHI